MQRKDITFDVHKTHARTMVTPVNVVLSSKIGKVTSLTNTVTPSFIYLPYGTNIDKKGYVNVFTQDATLTIKRGKFDESFDIYDKAKELFIKDLYQKFEKLEQFKWSISSLNFVLAPNTLRIESVGIDLLTTLSGLIKSPNIMWRCQFIAFIVDDKPVFTTTPVAKRAIMVKRSSLKNAKR